MVLERHCTENQQKMLLKFFPVLTVYLGTESSVKKVGNCLFGIGIFCMEIYQLKQLTCLRCQRFHFVDIFITSFEISIPVE